MPLVGTVGTQQEKKPPKNPTRKPPTEISDNTVLLSFSSLPKRIVHRITLEPFLKKKKVLKGFPFGLVGNYGYMQRIALQPTQILTKMWQRAGNEQ